MLLNSTVNCQLSPSLLTFARFYLKPNIQKMKTMASGPITSWQIDEENVDTDSHFIFLGSKISTDGDFSHESKRRLLLGRIPMTNLDSVLKSRDITLLAKVHIVKTTVLPCMDVRVGP